MLIRYPESSVLDVGGLWTPFHSPLPHGFRATPRAFAGVDGPPPLPATSRKVLTIVPPAVSDALLVYHETTTLQTTQQRNNSTAAPSGMWATAPHSCRVPRRHWAGCMEPASGTRATTTVPPRRRRPPAAALAAGPADSGRWVHAAAAGGEPWRSATPRRTRAAPRCRHHHRQHMRWWSAAGAERIGGHSAGGQAARSGRCEHHSRCDEKPSDMEFWRQKNTMEFGGGRPTLSPTATTPTSDGHCRSPSQLPYSKQCAADGDDCGTNQKCSIWTTVIATRRRARESHLLSRSPQDGFFKWSCETPPTELRYRAWMTTKVETRGCPRMAQRQRCSDRHARAPDSGCAATAGGHPQCAAWQVKARQVSPHRGAK